MLRGVYILHEDDECRLYTTGASYAGPCYTTSSSLLLPRPSGLPLIIYRQDASSAPSLSRGAGCIEVTYQLIEKGAMYSEVSNWGAGVGSARSIVNI